MFSFFLKLIQTNLDTINSVRGDFSLKPNSDQWRSFLFFLTWNYSNVIELIQPNTCKSWFVSGQNYYFFYLICRKSWWVEIIIMITQEKTKLENKLGKRKREKKLLREKEKLVKGFCSSLQSNVDEMGCLLHLMLCDKLKISNLKQWVQDSTFAHS